MRVVVEGKSDEEMARRVVTFYGHQSTEIRLAGGNAKIDPKLPNYSQAARIEPWVIFRDSDNACPVQLRARLLAAVPENHLFSLRIAHTMTEAWLMGGQRGFAEFFQVSADGVPRAPENEPHGKYSLLRVCGRSKSREIRGDVTHSDVEPGPLYSVILNDFARERWDVATAAENCPSLARAVRAIRSIPRAGY